MLALAVACSSPSESAPTNAAVPDTTNLTATGPCPPNLVIQTDWFPEMEHGGTYQLIGTGGYADPETFTYSGPLQQRYAGEHGVQRVEIRAGGAAIADTVIEAMTKDPTITLGYVNTDDVLAARGTGTDFMSVMATLDLSPQMLMWNPVRYSVLDFGDLARTGAQVLYFPGSTYIDYLVAQGFIDEDQLDDTYDGSPTRWLQSDGAVIQQGFASNEVFTYEQDQPDWNREVDFFLLHWLGYENYPATLSLPVSGIDAKRACLQQLVPVMQQAWVDFLVQPDATSTAIVDVLAAYDTFFNVSPELNARAIEVFKQYNIAGNGSDTTFGNFDANRVDRMVAIVSGVYADRDTPLPELSASDVMTNDFINPAIGLPEGWNSTTE